MQREYLPECAGPHAAAGTGGGVQKQTAHCLRLAQPLGKRPCESGSGLSTASLAVVILSTTLWGRRLKVPTLRAHKGKGPAQIYGEPAEPGVNLRDSQAGPPSSLPSARDAGPRATLGEAPPHTRGSRDSKDKALAIRMWPGLGEASGGSPAPRAGAAANIEFGKHHFARSAGRGRGRPDPGGGGSGSAFRRGH